MGFGYIFIYVFKFNFLSSLAKSDILYDQIVSLIIDFKIII